MLESGRPDARPTSDAWAGDTQGGGPLRPYPYPHHHTDALHHSSFSPSIFCYFNIHPRGRRERLLPGAPTTTTSTATAPVRGAADGGDGAAALHPPRPLRAQTPPRSWSGSLGPARLSLGPPAPLPASAAAARSSTAPTWIPPLPTRIRGARRRLARGGGEKAAVCWLVSGSSLPSPALGARPGRCFPRWGEPSRSS
jgi:hypothetical protein